MAGNRHPGSPELYISAVDRAGENCLDGLLGLALSVDGEKTLVVQPAGDPTPFAASVYIRLTAPAVSDGSNVKGL